MEFLRVINGKSRRDKVRNADIREVLMQESLKERIKRMRFQLYGYVKKMSRER